MIDKFQKQQLISLPIEPIAMRLGMIVVRHKSLCPFHDDHHPSLSFYQSRTHGTYHFKCHACGAKGNAIDLVMHILNVRFPEACQFIGQFDHLQSDNLSGRRGRANCQIVNRQIVQSFDASRYERYFLHPHLDQEAHRFLFQERRLLPDVVHGCRLNSYTTRHGVHLLQIPYYSPTGQLLAFQSRLPMSKQQCKQAGIENRFNNPQGSHLGLYNLPILNLLEDHEPLFIAEGASDCWSMLSAGHKAIALPSATTLRPEFIQTLQELQHSKHTPLHIYPDNDQSGEDLYQWLVSHLRDVNRHSLPNDCADYSELYIKEKG